VTPFDSIPDGDGVGLPTRDRKPTPERRAGQTAARLGVVDHDGLRFERMF